MTDEKKNIPRSLSDTTSLHDPAQIREQAERRVQSIQQPDFSSMRPEEIQQQFYELQVKQIEAGLEIKQLRNRLEEKDNQAALFNIITENMLDMFALTDMEGNFTFAGKSHEILGYEPDYLIGKNVMDFVHPEDLPGIQEEFAEFVASGHPRKVEYRNRCEDGTYLWFETLGNFITDENGSQQKIVFSSRDITARKQAEEALHLSHSLLSGIIESSPHGIFSLDREYRYTSFNKAHASWMKKIYNADIQRGCHFYEYQTVEADRQKSKPNMDRALNGEQFTVETFSGREDLSRAYFSVTHKPLRDKKGNIIGVSVFANDITEQKEAQFIIERVRYSIDNVNDSIFWVDDAGKFIDVNEAACNNLGYTREELLTMYVADIDPCFPHESWPKHWEEVSKSGLVRIESIHQTKEGQRFPVEVSVTNQQFGGKPYNYVVAQDITERKLAEAALRESEERYRNLYENAPAMMYSINCHGEIVDVSNAWLEKIGYTRAEVLGRKSVDFLTEESHKIAVEENLPKFYATGSAKNAPYQMVCKNGRIIDVLLSAISEKDNEGRFLRSIAVMDDVTERKQAEMALRESEQRFKTIIQNLPGAVFAHDLEGRLLFVNKTAFANTGYSEQELLAMTVPEIDSGGFTKDDMYQLWNALNIGESKTIQSVHTRKNGSEYPVEIHLNAISLDNKPVILPIAIDITERKKAKDALIESEGLFRGMFEDHSAVMLLIEPNTGQIIKANQAAAQYYGYFLEKMPQMKIQQLNILSPAEVKEWMRSAVNKQVNIFEFRHLLADGQVRDVEVHSTPITIQNQKLLFSIVRDITERKHAESAIRSEEEKFRTLVENTVDWVWQVDISGHYMYVSPQAKEFLGYEVGEILGKTPFDFMSSDEVQRILPFFSEAMEKRERIIALEDTLLAKNGSQVLFETNATPLYDQEGNMIGYMGTCRDITERKRAQEEREKLKTQLNQAQRMESVGRLAGGVAHDFNNKLSVINGYAELAMETIDASNPLRETIQEIYTAGQQSADIVRQLLAFARKQTISPVLLDLNDAISSMLKMLQRLIGENIDLQWHPGKNLWSVKIDPAQLDQIMANLAVNSRDAISDVGNLTIETDNITVDGDYCRSNPEAIPGQYVMVAVSDDGCGMEKEIRDLLFEPFFTTKEVGKGTGLGLPTVYGIVKQNNGFINVYSEPGEGTTFKLYFPSREETKPSLHSAKESTAQIPTGSETVLVVEDEKTILQMSKQMLERLGYTVETAGSASEALQISEEYDGAIDLLITDVIMPEMNGRDLSVRLSKNHPDLKTLYMSGYTANVIAHHGVLDEGVQFIQKPFSLRDLAVKVREVFEQE